MHSALEHLDHRPWQMPRRPWIWRQSWCDLLFAHWRVPASVLRSRVPRELVIQEREGSGWVGVVPFRMSGVSPRPFPDFPGLSSFPEINVRTYVEMDGRPGVWFFSLDATSPIAVRVARWFFHLPYFRASIDTNTSESGIGYRVGRRPEGPRFEATYREEGPEFCADPGTLDHWLTERYCLYAQNRRGAIFRTDVHHRPWALQRALCEIRRNELLEGIGIDPLHPDHVLFSRGVDVVLWSPQRAGDRS